MENVLDTPNHSSWFGDVKSSVMFHNYKLPEKVQPYAGVDVSWAEKGKDPRWELWTRMAIRILSSTFETTRMFAWGVEVMMGDRKDEANPFYCDSAFHNCPVTNEYDPYMPRMYRWDSKHQVITAA